MKLSEIEEQFREVSADYPRIMELAAQQAADWVEIRHEPGIEDLDGWRTRDAFRGYMREEATVFPGAFENFEVNLTPQVAGDHLAWNPLVFRGKLRNQPREVTIEYHVALYYEGGQLSRMVGRLTENNVREDVIAWLKAVESIGGFNPPPPEDTPAA